MNCHKDFIRLHLLDVTNADTIVTVTKNVILGINLNLKNCREQRYDCGKANESHSFTDSLNLAFGDAIMTTKVMKNSLEITLEITKLIKKSQKRNGKLKDNKNAIHQQEVSEVF